MLRPARACGVNDRLLLDKSDDARGVLLLDGQEYPLRGKVFHAVDPANPYALTPEEEELVNRLHASFVNSEKLRKHMRCLFSNGSMYLVRNNNLLYHASIPLNEDGSFKEVVIDGKKYKGKSLLDKIDQMIRLAYYGVDSPEKQYARDYIWYLWCGADAPTVGKDKMATFKRSLAETKAWGKGNDGFEGILPHTPVRPYAQRAYTGQDPQRRKSRQGRR